MNLASRKPNVTVEAVTHKIGIQEAVERIETILRVVRFTIFQGFYKDFSSRYELVVHLLAVLEMARWEKAQIFQEEINGPLWVALPEMDASKIPVHRLQTSVATTKDS